MSSTEQKNKVVDRKSQLMQMMADRYEQLTINGRSCFRKQDGVILSLSAFSKEQAIVVEYADNFEEAVLNRFEDGDRFYLEDMDGETMFQNMLLEIEQ